MYGVNFLPFEQLFKSFLDVSLSRQNTVILDLKKRSMATSDETPANKLPTGICMERYTNLILASNTPKGTSPIYLRNIILPCTISTRRSSNFANKNLTEK